MKMFKNLVLIVFIIIYGCTALPTPEEDLSVYFNYEDSNARLVGGTQAAIGSHPYMMATTTGRISRTFQCGATIINERHVLTAAHCTDAWYSRGSLVSSLRGTVGTNRWNSGGVDYTFSGNITHPAHDMGDQKNDITFLITSSAIRFTNLISPITLNFDFIGSNVPVLVAGWGRNRPNGAVSRDLMEIYTRTIDGQQCIVKASVALAANNQPQRPVDPTVEICVFHSAGVGTCHNDSGGPLIRSDNRQQVGIVSWGIPCAVGGPDMFTRISAYRDWITSVIN